jgi:hypothetical protein
VFAGLVNPGNLVIGRRIDTEATTAGTIDTAVFTGPRANYTIAQNAGVVTVTDNVGADGVDTLTGIENLRFSDGDRSIAPLATLAPAAGVSPAFANQQIGTTSTNRTFTLTNSGLSPLTFTAATRFTLTGTNPSNFVIGATTCTTTLAPGTSCTVQVAFRPTAPAGAKSANLVATNNSGGTAGSTQSIGLTGTATAAPPQLPPTGTPTATAPLMVPGATLTGTRGTLADPNGIASVTLQWQQTAANGTVFTDIAGASATTPTSTFRILPVLPIINNPNRCRSYRVAATITDNLGKVEARVFSAATPRVIGIPACTAVAPALAAAAAPVSTPLGQALAPRVPAAPLAASSVRVVASATAPLSVSASVPAGASTVAITVFRLNSAIKRTGKARQSASSVHVGTVYRKTTKAKRYVFRLTEKPFRNLKSGRYMIQIRVGASRKALGPATTRQVTITRSRSTSAR